ncbi:hypothetical protein DPEC_G00281670, partial [Dallia pectoralis]
MGRGDMTRDNLFWPDNCVRALSERAGLVGVSRSAVVIVKVGKIEVCCRGRRPESNPRGTNMCMQVDSSLNHWTTPD